MVFSTVPHVDQYYQKISMMVIFEPGERGCMIALSPYYAEYNSNNWKKFTYAVIFKLVVNINIKILDHLSRFDSPTSKEKYLLIPK